jgi:hypothetical protein
MMASGELVGFGMAERSNASVVTMLQAAIRMCVGITVGRQPERHSVRTFQPSRGDDVERVACDGSRGDGSRVIGDLYSQQVNVAGGAALAERRQQHPALEDQLALSLRGRCRTFQRGTRAPGSVDSR